MRAGMVEWPDGLEAGDSDWVSIADTINQARLDILITNELPFGEWIAAKPIFDRRLAQQSIDLHDAGLTALGNLAVRTIITSRPVWAGNRLANEAVVLRGERIHAWRRKQYFPEESGWHETTWYEAKADTFPTFDADGMVMGVLLCTELMFNERARRYGRAGASVIAVPRATPDTMVWIAAAQMAAIVSGSYVVSSNRSCGHKSSSFGGGAFASAPDGSRQPAIVLDSRLAVFEMDIEVARDQKVLYPCYVEDFTI